MKRLTWIFGALCALVLLTFLLFGDIFDSLFSPQGSQTVFQDHLQWAGPLGAGLLISDLILPIPTTVIIGAMAAVLGIGPAVAWGWLGLSLAGITGYSLARLGGRRLADRLASPAEQKQNENFFNTWGGLAVILSRMLPILPEALSVTAGLSGMKAGPFCVSVILGSLPPAVAFAWIGASASEAPQGAIWSTVALMGACWLGYRKVAQQKWKAGK